MRIVELFAAVGQFNEARRSIMEGRNAQVIGPVKLQDGSYKFLVIRNGEILLHSEYKTKATEYAEVINQG